MTRARSCAALTFDPQFKLWIIGNQKPSICTVDEAMRARINIVPFSVTIPPEERDPRLKHFVATHGKHFSLIHNAGRSVRFGFGWNPED